MGLAWAKGLAKERRRAKERGEGADERTIHRPIPPLEHAVHAVGGLELLPEGGDVVIGEHGRVERVAALPG